MIKKLWYAMVHRPPMSAWYYPISCDIWYAKQLGVPTIQPNERGIKLLAFWHSTVGEFFYQLRILRCKHENMTGHGNPESGHEYMECPDCGFEWSGYH